MAKSPSVPSRARRPKRRARGAVANAPSGPFWTELLSTLRDLRAEVKRLADARAAAPDRHIDWDRFAESRPAAAEERERYWREVGPAATAK